MRRLNGVVRRFAQGKPPQCLIPLGDKTSKIHSNSISLGDTVKGLGNLEGAIYTGSWEDTARYQEHGKPVLIR